MQLKPPCSFFHTQTSEYAILKKFYFLQQVNTPILIISCAFLHALFLLISRLASFSLAVYKRVGILNVTKCVQMYSFYLSSSGNGNHGTASKNRIIICNSTHAVAVDRMVINISISSLSWIFKQHYRDSSWLKIAWQYCIWTLVLTNTLSHTQSEFQFLSARGWKRTSVAHRRQTEWHFLTSLLPVTLQIKAQQ